MEVIAIFLFVYAVCCILKDLFKIFGKKSKQVDEFTAYRHDLSLKLHSFIKDPPPIEEWEEWIRIAKYSDQLYFPVCGSFAKNFERLEDRARQIFEQISASH